MSDNNPGNWLEFDFKKYKVKITGYSLKTNNGPPNQQYHLKNWVIEGSQDGSEWIEIDKQENNNDLNGSNYSHYYPISDSNEEFQYVRIKSTGENHYNYQLLQFQNLNFWSNPNLWQNQVNSQTFHYLMIANIEFYGEIRIPKSNNNEVDPVQTEPVIEEQKVTRDSLTIGTIVIILDGELQGKYGVVIADKGAGKVVVGGYGYPAQEFDQDYLIGTSTKLEIGNVDAAGAEAAIDAAAKKVPDMVDYLKSPFSLKKEMKF